VDRRKIVSMNGKDLCLGCSESIAAVKVYTIAKHYNSEHKEKYKTVSVLLEENKWRV
jgi:hypothetical protein